MEWPNRNSFEVDANNCSVVRELSLLKCAVTLWSLDRLFNVPWYHESIHDMISIGLFCTNCTRDIINKDGISSGLL